MKVFRIRDDGDRIQKIRPVRPWSPPPPENFQRGTQPRRHAGHYALMARGPVFPRLRRWIPDSPLERAEGWLKNHPRLYALAGAVLFAGIGFLIVVLAWRPWQQ